MVYQINHTDQQAAELLQENATLRKAYTNLVKEFNKLRLPGQPPAPCEIKGEVVISQPLNPAL